MSSFFIILFCACKREGVVRFVWYPWIYVMCFYKKFFCNLANQGSDLPQIYSDELLLENQQCQC